MAALKIKKGATSHSAYNLRPNFSDVVEKHTLAVLVENEPGALARVIGLFSGRGYNIDSLTVAEVDHTGHLSRITVVTTGTPQVIDQLGVTASNRPQAKLHAERAIQAVKLAAPFRNLPPEFYDQWKWLRPLRFDARLNR